MGKNKYQFYWENK